MDWEKVKDDIGQALARSENTTLPDPYQAVADCARLCVRTQLSIETPETPDLYVIHRCLETLYRQMRHAAQIDNEAKLAFDRTLADIKHYVGVTGSTADWVYAWIAPKARLIKAVVQMFIGFLAVARLIAMMWNGNTWWAPDFPGAEQSLAFIGAALAAATVVELAYTLFTDGPDEVLDPLMLGISAFLIIELGKSHTQIVWGTGLGLLLSAITLGILFAIRQRFIEDTKPMPPFWWRLRRARSSATRHGS
jgi:hypothetical protein